MYEAKFQTFDDPGERAATAPRVKALRAELKRRGLDGFIVPHADRHQSEYLPPSEERLAWLTGFTGSAGSAVVLMDRAVLFTDGRYTLQAREQTDPALFTIEHMVEMPRRSMAGAQSHRRGPSSATIHGCTPPKTPRNSARPAPRRARRWSRSSPTRSTRSGRTGRRRRSGRWCCTTCAMPAKRRRASSRASATNSASCAPTRWWCPIRMRWPGPSTSAAPTWRTCRWRSASPSFRSEGRPALYLDGRKLTNEVRDRAGADRRRCASRRTSSDALTALGRGQKTVRLDQSTAAMRWRGWSQARRQDRARRRSDRADEGGEESGRDRGRARARSCATARR